MLQKLLHLTALALLLAVLMGNSALSSGGGGTMRAVIRPGLRFDAQYPAPRAPRTGTDEVLLRVHAAAINPVDYKVGKSLLGPIVGLDVAGTVEAVGDASRSELRVGDEVYGTARGALAERVLATAGALARKPRALSWAQAAAMPTAYLTALQGLRDHGALARGGRVLVVGASGGCGTAAVQLATALGAAEVVGVCSGKNAELVRAQGAARVVDYTKEPLSAACAGGAGAAAFDVVFDAATNSGAGENYKAAAIACLRKGAPGAAAGQYVAINGGAGMWLRMFTIGQRKNEHLFLTNAVTADLEQLAALADGDGGAPEEGGVTASRVRPVIALQLPFTAEGVSRGFALLQSRRAVGKVVFEMEMAQEVDEEQQQEQQQQ